MLSVLAVLAQLTPLRWTIPEIAIAVVVIAGIIAIVIIGLKQLKVEIPPWFIQVLYVIAVVVVIAIAIKILAGLF